MIEKELVLEKKSRFFAINAHLIFDGLGANEFFQKNYLNSVKDLQKDAASGLTLLTDFT